MYRIIFKYTKKETAHRERAGVYSRELCILNPVSKPYAMQLFSPAPPDPFISPYGPVHWYTWSAEFRSFLRSVRTRDAFRELKPELVFIEGFNEYNYTWQLPPERIPAFDPEGYFARYADVLFNTTPGEELLFFDGLIDTEISGEEFHKIFSIFRSLISHNLRNEMEALYTPLTVSNKGYFPLHCDLYIPRLLFNVYESVPNDDSGASLFLRTDTLCRDILPLLTKMPAETQGHIAGILSDSSYTDRYEEFYELLNNRYNPWYYQLKRRSEQQRFAIRFGKGQGYMLHDRRWLHGRLKPSGLLTEKRVHRLVFNSSAPEVPTTAKAGTLTEIQA